MSFRKILVLFLLWGAIGVAFWPSLNHMPRADQVRFLYDVEKDSDVSTILKQSYSWNREYLKGDFILFKPLHYGLMGIQWKLLGHRFDHWQLVGMIYHGMAVTVMFLLLCELDAGLLLPLALTFLFSVFTFGTEAVIWTHANAYVLCCGLSLGSLLLIFRLESSHRLSLFLPIPMLLILASFTYEFCVIFTFILAIYLMIMGRFIIFDHVKMRWLIVISLSLFLVVIIYVASSVIDLAFRGNLHSKFLSEAVMTTWDAFWYTLLHWLKAIFIPESVKINPGGRFNPVWLPIRGNFLAIMNCFISMVALGSFVGITVNQLKHRRDWVAWSRVILISMLTGSYLLLIVVGRIVPRGVGGGFNQGIYYSYWFCALLMVLICAIVGQSKSTIPKPSNYFYRILRITFSMSIIILAGAHLVATFDLNRRGASYFGAQRLAVNKIKESLDDKSSKTRKFSILNCSETDNARSVCEHMSWFENRTFAECLFRNEYSDSDFDIVFSIRELESNLEF